MLATESKLLLNQVELKIWVSTCHKKHKSMKPFANNRELFDYLILLASMLRERKFNELSEAVTFASQQASGMSAEFLGESRIALRRVLCEEGGILTVQERNDLSGVLKQLDDSFDKR